MPGTGTTSLAAFSADGLSFAIGQGMVGAARIWSAEDGKPISVMQMRTYAADMEFSPDGSRLLISSWWNISFGSVSQLWDVAKGIEIAALDDHKSDTRGGKSSHDGRLIATVSLDGTARLWNGISGEFHAALGEETRGLTLPALGADLQDQEVNSAFSPDDHLLATASLNGAIRIWDVEHASVLTTLSGHEALVEHMEFSPADNSILTASHDGTARLWDIDGVLTSTLFHKDAPTFAVFSPNGEYLVTGGGDSVAHLWDVASGRERVTLETQGGRVQYAAFNPNGNILATASQLGQIIIWDVESGREITRLDSRGPNPVHVQFSPDGDLLESASVHGVAQIWDATRGAELAVLKTSGYLPNAVFSPDGQLVLTATNDNVARVLKTDGSEFRALAGHQNRIKAAAFSPDGLLVLTGSMDRTARLWSIKDRSNIATLKGHSDVVTDVAFSPNGQLLLTASRDGTARIWSTRDGKEKIVLRGHRGSVDTASFSPNGSYVLTASSADRTVRLWAAESGRLIAVLASREDEANRPALTRAVFSPDGTRIAIVSGEEGVRIVRAFPTVQDLIDYAKRAVPRKLTPCERRRFFLPVSGDVGDCPN